MAQDLNSLIAGGSDPGSIFQSATSGFTDPLRLKQQQQQQQRPQPTPQPGGGLPRDANGNIDWQAASAQLLQPYAVGGSAYGATPTYVPGYGYRPMF